MRAWCRAGSRDQVGIFVPALPQCERCPQEVSCHLELVVPQFNRGRFAFFAADVSNAMQEALGEEVPGGTPGSSVAFRLPAGWAYEHSGPDYALRCPVCCAKDR